MRMKTLFGLTAALALGAGALAIAPSTAEAKHGHGWKWGHYRGHHFGHYPRFHHRPHFGAYAYAGGCWRVRYTPWGPQRVWVCGPRYHYDY